jgi:hypothetical protein
LAIDTPKNLLVLIANRARFSQSRCVLLISNHASAARTSSWSGSCGVSLTALEVGQGDIAGPSGDEVVEGLEEPVRVGAMAAGISPSPQSGRNC